MELPLPAGAMLISPWVDLLHSFPSIMEDAGGDYVPNHGFHYKPSMAWPPPSQENLERLRQSLHASETVSVGQVCNLGQKHDNLISVHVAEFDTVL
jgi:acetyl esterase/lipase